LGWTGDFQKFCGSGLDRIQTYRMIRTGLGLKNFTVCSSLLCIGILAAARPCRRAA